MHAKFEHVLGLQRTHADDQFAVFRPQRARIPARIDALDAWHGAGGEKVAHVIPVVRRPEGEPQHDLVTCPSGHASFQLLPQLAWRAVIGVLEGAVESPDAAETGGGCNLRDRQRRLVEQTFGEVQAPSLRDGNR